MNLFTEGIKEKHNIKATEYAKRNIHHRESTSCLGYNCVAGIQGCYFINETRVFLTSVEKSMDWKRQSSRSAQPCFYTCFTVKGTESRKATVSQSKRRKSFSSQMWTPKKSVVVKPPDLEIKGKCLALEHNKAKETVDVTSISVVDITGDQSSNEANKDISSQQEDCKEDKQDVENSNDGKIFLALLEASLKKKLNPEYIDIIPSRLNRSTTVRSPQFDNISTTYSRISPRQGIKEERLPLELKFGIRNPAKKLNSSAVLKRPEVARPKIELSFYRGKLEPLLPREKPSENLHAELEREEAGGKTINRSS